MDEFYQCNFLKFNKLFVFLFRKQAPGKQDDFSRLYFPLKSGFVSLTHIKIYYITTFNTDTSLSGPNPLMRRLASNWLRYQPEPAGSARSRL